jgi:ferredoxin
MGSRRSIIRIDEEKCNGCGQCIPNCPEGALQVIDGKARLISDLFCDGLGACIGHCPEGAITVEQREAAPYNERKVMANIVKQGPNTIRAHLEHLKEHGADEHYQTALAYLKRHRLPVPEAPAAEERLPCGCPGSRVMDLACAEAEVEAAASQSRSHLRNWPIQITLVPPSAPYLKNADILIAADCVGSAYPSFHADLVKGRVLLIGCPKLDDADAYVEKLTQMFRQNKPRSVTVAHMTVPCCFGLGALVQQAIAASGVKTEYRSVTIGLDGQKQ